MKLLFKAFLALVVLLGLFVGYSFHISSPAVDTTWDVAKPQVIAKPELALTFARTDSALIRVTRHEGNAVVGFDITAALDNSSDLIKAYSRLGYEGLAAATGPEINVPLADLIMPVDFRYPSIAAGTNYSDHADEVHMEDPPFLFPKLARPSAWNAPVNYHSRLDYEAELAMVPLADIRTPDDKVEYGLVLCNDFTDRWTLIRQIDLDETMGTTGFAAAKGQPTFLPTGYLFVIPKSPGFYESVQLELAVNGMARQRFVAGDMIMKIDQIVAEAFARSGLEFMNGDQAVDLLPSAGIPRGTLILTGTGAGVAFRPVNLWNPGFYLQPGDRVVTRATYLGHLDNSVAVP